MIDNNETLSKDKIFNTFFWGGIILGLVISFLIGLKNWKDFYLCWEPICFSNLLIIFKFPISIVTAGLTLSGFRAIVFRSKQTTMQIEGMIRQNNYSNYLAHKKEFMTILESIEKQNFLEDRNEKVLKFYNKEMLYSVLFPKNTPINVEFESTGIPNSLLSIVFDSYVEKLAEIRSLSDSISSGERTEKKHKNFACILSEVMGIFKRLNIELSGYQQVDSMYQTYFEHKNLDPKIPKKFSLISQNLSGALEIMITNFLPAKEIKPRRYHVFDSIQSIKIDEIMRRLTIATKFDK